MKKHKLWKVVKILNKILILNLKIVWISLKRIENYKFCANDKRGDEYENFREVEKTDSNTE